MAHLAHFFDFDHTLFDSDASEALAFEHAVAGRADAASLFATYKDINSALWREVESAGRPAAEVRTLRFERLVEQSNIEADPIALADAFTVGMQEFGELYPDAEAVVTALRENGPVVMVTNAISEIQRRRIERLGIASLFDAIIISSEVGVAKPDPNIFGHAFATLEAAGTTVERRATLMVGDSLTSDMAGGVAAGLTTCWFNPHGKPRPTAIDLDHEIHQLDQLLDL